MVEIDLKIEFVPLPADRRVMWDEAMRLIDKYIELARLEMELPTSPLKENV